MPFKPPFVTFNASKKTLTIVHGDESFLPEIKQFFDVIPNVNSLTWHKMPATFLSALLEIPNLTALDISYSSLDTTSLHILANAKYLEHLKITGCKDEATDYLVHNRRLQSLSVNIHSISNAGIDSVLRMKSLIELDIRGDFLGFDEQGLKLLASTTTLKRLKVNSHYLNTNIISSLANHRTITHLDLSKAQLNREQLEMLFSSASLESLSLKGVNFTRYRYTEILMSALPRLAENLRLKHLNLSGCRLSDAEILQLCAVLQKNHSLTSLNLSHGDYGKQSFQALIACLKTNRTLCSIKLNPLGNFYCLNVDRALIEELEKRLENNRRKAALSCIHTLHGSFKKTAEPKYSPFFGQGHLLGGTHSLSKEEITEKITQRFLSNKKEAPAYSHSIKGRALPPKSSNLTKFFRPFSGTGYRLVEESHDKTSELESSTCALT